MAFCIHENAILLGPIGHQSIERLSGMSVQLLAKAVNDLLGKAVEARRGLLAENFELVIQVMRELGVLKIEKFAQCGHVAGIFGFGSCGMRIILPGRLYRETRGLGGFVMNCRSETR